jgi:hypothetical protein
MLINNSNCYVIGGIVIWEGLVGLRRYKSALKIRFLASEKSGIHSIVTFGRSGRPDGSRHRRAAFPIRGFWNFWLWLMYEAVIGSRLAGPNPILSRTWMLTPNPRANFGLPASNQELKPKVLFILFPISIAQGCIGQSLAVREMPRVSSRFHRCLVVSPCRTRLRWPKVRFDLSEVPNRRQRKMQKFHSRKEKSAAISTLL